MGEEVFARAPAIAAWVKGNSSADDKLLVWGSEAELYFLSQRLPATHQLNLYALTGGPLQWPEAEQDFLKAASDGSARVVLITEVLDQANPFQAALGRALLEHYKFRQDLFPPYWVGLPRI